MTQSLVITVHLHDARYHGSGKWPPAPARLFQALIAGAARGAEVGESAAEWLTWLEGLPAPSIAAPHARPGQSVLAYVPNNDLDAFGGDPARLGEVKVGKGVRPWLLDAAPLFRYVWPATSDAAGPGEPHFGVVHRLYQFGRGVDMAWARVEVMDTDAVEDLLEKHQGVVYRPTGGRGGVLLDCPCPGSFKSLRARYALNRRRFDDAGGKILFRRPPKPAFREVAYGAPPQQWLFELRTTAPGTPFARLPLSRAAAFTTEVRDRAMDRLTAALPDRATEIETAFRNRDGRPSPDSRVRIMPLPSIGADHADRAVRRVLVQVPPTVTLAGSDVAWAFSGLVVRESIDEATGEVHQTFLAHAGDAKMCEHYGVRVGGAGARLWRTVTAAALPETAARRRIDPSRRSAEGKGGAEYSRELQAARGAVVQALRHAGMPRAAHVHVQRTPFEARGALAEAFAAGSRFDRHRMWHVEVGFVQPVRGPVVLGDGRFTGLGLMAPTSPQATEGIVAFAITGEPSGVTAAADLARRLRRAVMARVQHLLGTGRVLPEFFHGHRAHGVPSDHDHAHLFYQADVARRRLLILAPHVALGTDPSWQDRRYIELLEEAIEDFRILTVAQGRRLMLNRTPVDPDTDPILRRAPEWTSATPYVPCRHHKKGSPGSPAAALATDVRCELERRGLGTAVVSVLSAHEGPRGGVRGSVSLTFLRPVRGPILLGRTCHIGGGLFEGATTGRDHP